MNLRSLAHCIALVVVLTAVCIPSRDVPKARAAPSVHLPWYYRSVASGSVGNQGPQEWVLSVQRMAVPVTQSYILAHRPSGLSYIHPVKNTDVTEWDIGAVTSVVGSLPTTKVLETQASGCLEGPCPDAFVVVFHDGSVKAVSNPAYIDQLAQIDQQSYLAMTGFCELAYPNGCRLRVYAINTVTKSVNRIFFGDQVSTKQALCGMTLSYRSRTYTVRVVPTDQYNGQPHLYDGIQTCH